MNNKNIKIGFFGTPEYAVTTLEKLTAEGYKIEFIVTMPDRQVGRGLAITAPAAKLWATKNSVPIIQPENLKDNPELEKELKYYNCDVFVVIAYGKIIPDSILNIPKYKSVNIHASLLPELRGSCPIESAILEDKKDTGITIIKMDSLMDHGPILAKRSVSYEPWPPTAEQLGLKLVNEGAALLTEILPKWVAGEISEQPQNHDAATYTKKITKADAQIDLSADPYLNFRKIQAYHEWPQAFFFIEKDSVQKRVKITQASFKAGALTIEKVIPEGGREMDYGDFQRGYSA